ncbi:MAG TPA: hypothetical protein DEO88_11095, partial [Syntrophobacteraceae bacterium]|nr:hypothetical protein [Syntrophobacteraceae bacterium]
VPEALTNTMAIADRCQLKIELGAYHFPVFSLESDETIEECFARTARDGLDKRLEQLGRHRGALDSSQLQTYE